jgi:hypothetical protein
MKKLLFLLLATVLIMTGCTSKKPAKFTVLGDYTPYNAFPENFIGKVEKVIEKNYWAIPDGDTFKKGNLITIKDRDSLNWSNDFEATFDIAGDIVSCNYLNENNQSIYKWELMKENNILTSAKVILKDTVRISQKLKCNADGKIIEISTYRSIVDTLISSSNIKYSEKGDTITRQFFNYKGAPTAKQIYLYNDEGQFLRRESYNEEGTFNGANDVEYNDKGKISRLTFYYKDKKVFLDGHYTYDYDQKGNWTKAIAKDNKGNVVIEERTYTYFE